MNIKTKYFSSIAFMFILFSIGGCSLRTTYSIGPYSSIMDNEIVKHGHNASAMMGGVTSEKKKNKLNQYEDVPGALVDTDREDIGLISGEVVEIPSAYQPEKDKKSFAYVSVASSTSVLLGLGALSVVNPLLTPFTASTLIPIGIQLSASVFPAIHESITGKDEKCEKNKSLYPYNKIK